MGIGASAGGLVALRKLFSEVPEDPGLAFVVVLHLSPEHESHMTELIQPHCPMPIQQVSETVTLEPNRIYVIPPNANLNTIDTHLRLSAFEAERGSRAPIDHFLRTLAETHAERAVGIVLTGMGSDGTLGLRHVREHGGLTIAQDPDEAEYDGMPRSAITAGVVDRVLPIAEMPEHIIRFAGTEPKVPAAEADEGEPTDILQEIFDHVRTITGRDFDAYKRSTILRRMRRRMQLHHIEAPSAYLKLLRQVPGEAEALADDLLITVTEFFRDPAAFECLEKEVIPRLFEGKGAEDEVRIWSVGCSTGEEAYSLAILLLEEAARRQEHPPAKVQIFASDLHDGVLKKAREGIYPESIHTSISPERLRRFFTHEDSNYRVRSFVRDVVVFTPHNLLRDPPFARLDLITSRNILMYFQRDAQRDVARIFHYALKPDGFLLVGSSETVEPSDLFKLENKEHCLHRRRDLHGRELHLPMPLFLQGKGRHALKGPGKDRAERSGGFGVLHEKMAERYAPPSILVNEHHEVVHYSAHAGRYLLIPGGEPTNNVYKLVQEPLGIELRATLYAARESGAGARSKPIQLEGQPYQIVLRVRPAEEPDLKGYFLVIFDQIEPPEAAGGPADQARADSAVRELETELDLTKKRLGTAIGEYEASREEMYASLEELQSSNEELRSTTEELETSKEELQSMNEELVTANQENRHRLDELSQLTADLQNFLAATDIPTLFLDRELRIVRYTPHVDRLFNVRRTDLGRPLADLSHRLGENALNGDARQVLERLVPMERELQSHQGRWYLTRVLPYRTVDDRINGVVMTFIDITERKASEEALRVSNAALASRTAEVEHRVRQLQKLTMEISQTEDRERRRMAEILHDDLQQQLASTKFHLTILNGRAKGDPAQQALIAKLDGMLKDAIQTSRDLSHDLSPATLYTGDMRQTFQTLAEKVKSRHGMTVHVAGDPVHVQSDALKAFLCKAGKELLFNAVKHAEVKAAKVRLRRFGRYVCLAIADRGRGFDPTAMAEHDGLGLLSIRERIELLGGRMKIRSRIGEGSRFLITVPDGENAVPARRTRHPRREVQSRPGTTAETVQTVSEGTIHVVIADDHEIVRQGLVGLLGREPDMQLVGEAANGREAVDLAYRMRPDVLIMDVSMPLINGIEATRQIKAHVPEARVIGLSMATDPDTAERMRQAGADAYLCKTDSAEELLAAIRGAAAAE